MRAAAPLRIVVGVVCALSWSLPARAADVVEIAAVSRGSVSQTNVPLTFGQVFAAGDVPVGAWLEARTAAGSAVPLQIDPKTRYPDGSLRHAVVTAIVPSLPRGDTVVLELATAPAPPAASPVPLSALLETSFDVTVQLDVEGVRYSASARRALDDGAPTVWLHGPLVGEWLATAPLRSADGRVHPHLAARFEVRAYAGLERARVGVIVENAWSRVAGPRRYDYDVAIEVEGKGTVFSEEAVPHYRQSRWRRVVWWGDEALVDARHDTRYLMATRAVPTYDPAIVVQDGALDDMSRTFAANSRLMDVGALEPYMPSGGGRPEIAPLPSFTAAYLISQDFRAKDVTIGHGVQAGAWPLHFRDESTGLPISLDDHPAMTILGSTSFFPECGGDCSSPYTPDVAHHPSLAYVPYLVSGDHYLLEELQFWANWIMFYGAPDRHGGAAGLVVWDQVRAQAWGLRTLAEAAYATPDDDRLKPYFESKLSNNIDYYLEHWVDSNPLGYITNTGAAAWLDLERIIATWMDDFLTWSFGHVVALGYERARPVLEWKARFPVGRLTDPDMCWILASTYWVTVRDDVYLGGSGEYVDTWDEWRRAAITSSRDDAFQGTNDVGGREQELIEAECNSPRMAAILGLERGQMIGYFAPDGYSANLQPAVAAAVEADVPGAVQAFETLRGAASYPLEGYGREPQWGIVPANWSWTPPRRRRN